MTNHNRLNIGRLSWLVILLSIGILAVGSMTKTFADSPGMTGFNDISGGQISIEPETTGLPSDSPPFQMIIDSPATITPPTLDEIDVSALPKPADDTVQYGNDTPADPEQPKADDPAEPERPAVPMESELLRLDLSGPAPKDSGAQKQQANNPGAQDNNSDSPPPVSDNDVDPQKAKSKEIADRLKNDGYKVKRGSKRGKRVVTGTKTDERGRVVDEYIYEIDENGKVVESSRRTVSRTVIYDDNGKKTGTVTTTTVVSGTKTVITTLTKKFTPLGTISCKRVVTKEPGKADKVEHYKKNWKGVWVKVRGECD